MKKAREGFYESSLYEKEGDFNLIDFLYVVTRRWGVILLTAVPIFAFGVFRTLTKPTLYRAETTLMVSNGFSYTAASLDGAELSVNQRLVTTYVEVARSHTILKRVIDKFDLEETPETLFQKMSITPVPDTELLKLSYSHEDPFMAAGVANELGNEFIVRVREIMNFQNIKVVEAAVPPEKPMPRKIVLTLAAFLAIALGGGMFSAFIVEFFFSRVRSPKDIEEVLECPMLGIIPDYNEIEKAKGEKK